MKQNVFHIFMFGIFSFILTRSSSQTWLVHNLFTSVDYTAGGNNKTQKMKTLLSSSTLWTKMLNKSSAARLLNGPVVRLFSKILNNNQRSNLRIHNSNTDATGWPTFNPKASGAGVGDACVITTNKVPNWLILKDTGRYFQLFLWRPN